MHRIWCLVAIAVLILAALLFLLLHVRRRFSGPQQISQPLQVGTVQILSKIMVPRLRDPAT